MRAASRTRAILSAAIRVDRFRLRGIFAQENDCTQKDLSGKQRAGLGIRAPHASLISGPLS
jgi:hypothetical protein